MLNTEIDTVKLGNSKVIHPNWSDSVSLGELWKDSPTLLIFLRHFACIGCSAHITEIYPRLQEFYDLGIRVVLIGNGQPHHIEGFIKRHHLEDKHLDIVTDPSLKSYQNAGFKRSFLSTFGFTAILNIIKAFGKGHIQNSVKGDLLQQGGVILIHNGSIHFYFKSKSLGDFPDTNDLISEALKIQYNKDKNLFL